MTVQQRPETSPGIDLADELWTPAHLARYLHCGRSTAYAILARPGFPLPITCGLRRRLWVAREVRDWTLGGRPAQTDATATATATEASLPPPRRPR